MPRHLKRVEPVPEPAAQEKTVHLQRSTGNARLSFKRRGSRTVLGDVYQAGCCKVRFPRAEPGTASEAVLINTAGGLTDGDNLETVVHWKASARATVTSQAAERIYRSRGEPARITNTLTVEKDATALWLPQETILFDGGRFTRRLDADIAEGGRLLACESTIFGRTAMGETVESGAIFDTWRVRYSGRLVFADGFRLEGGISDLLSRPAIARGASAAASVIYTGPDATSVVDPLRDVLSGYSTTCGCSVVGPVLVARILARSGAEMRHDLVALLQVLLQHLNKVQKDYSHPCAALLPRVWSC